MTCFHTDVEPQGAFHQEHHQNPKPRACGFRLSRSQPGFEAQVSSLIKTDSWLHLEGHKFNSNVNVSVTCHPLKIKSLSLALSCFCATFLEIITVEKYHAKEELYNSFTELADVLSTYCSCPRRCKFSNTKYNNDDDNHRADNEN